MGTLRKAARDSARVAGLTHQHYKYPARFSPTFARAAIEAFSNPGDLVLDPYMGGGTTVVEAMAAGRRAVGCDINSLAVFVAQAKTTVLTDLETEEIEAWVLGTLDFRYRNDVTSLQSVFCQERTRNLHLPRARALKKFIGMALASCDQLSTSGSRLFARCALLNVTQWALNGRRRPTPLAEFREKLVDRTFLMLDATREFTLKHPKGPHANDAPVLVHGSAEHASDFEPFKSGSRADVVVTSPPYPGIHVLYHRWQVDGRRETPAPYWIANCFDGQGDAFYNFGSRKQASHDDYFKSSLRTLEGVRRAMRTGAVMVQLIAFSDARRQLPRYLFNMTAAGFRELRLSGTRLQRIWREVPGRSWHADLQGSTGGAREVVLLHEAV